MLPEQDLSTLPGDARSAAFDEIALHEARAPFDFARGPLIRARLLRLDSDDHVLLVTMHHVISDGWSLAVLVRELGALYPAFHMGHSDPLPPLPVQYADYALWQRERMHGERLERDMAFWREHLSGAPSLIDLPLDRSRPPIPGPSRRCRTLRLPGRYRARLARIGASGTARRSTWC